MVDVLWIPAAFELDTVVFHLALVQQIVDVSKESHTVMVDFQGAKIRKFSIVSRTATGTWKELNKRDIQPNENRAESCWVPLGFLLRFSVQITNNRNNQSNT